LTGSAARRGIVFYSVKIAYKLKALSSCFGDWLDGKSRTNTNDVQAAIGWLARNTPVRIMNYSYGGQTGQDGDPSLYVCANSICPVFNRIAVCASRPPPAVC